MLLIVSHHYVVNSGVLEKMYENPLSTNSIFLFFVWGVGKNWYQLLYDDYRILYVQRQNYSGKICEAVI